MTNGVIATIGGASSAAVTQVGAALAVLLHTGLRPVGPVDGLQAGTNIEDILREIDAADISLTVVADGAGIEQAAGHLISASPKPIVVVPATPATRRPLVIARVLLPLDGTWEAAAAVAPTAELLTNAGVDLIVLHVFDEATVPRFWDQAAHARRAWEDEFRARYCRHPGVRVRLRSGAPGEHVVSVAADENVDLITLGWAQRLDLHRARTVRQTVTKARVPVMLMPVSRPATDQPANHA
ncbi:MAG TPA: universal stress protein [Pilimelia sp.]|nr:universal stress protein [Pilimelia sp.]